MGRHNRFSARAPRPSRVRFAVSRAAAITLVLALIAWVCFSILFAPADSNDELVTVEVPGTASENLQSSQTPTEPTEQALVTVHVVGEVKHPGVYELQPGSRVNDAINAAGGMSEEARPELLNLASPVVDGQQILLPGTADPTQGVPHGLTPLGTLSPSATADAAQGLININQADAETLTRLPGIGPALAGRIIDFREANGPFSAVDELEQVSGIGPVLLNRLKDLVQAP